MNKDTPFCSQKHPDVKNVNFRKPRLYSWDPPYKRHSQVDQNWLCYILSRRIAGRKIWDFKNYFFWHKMAHNLLLSIQFQPINIVLIWGGNWFSFDFKLPWYQNTRKYPICGYILGVLMHTTAWNQYWGKWWNTGVSFNIPYPRH